MGIAISRKTVQKLMGEEGLAGLPVRKHWKNLVNVATFADLVQRKFTRDARNKLWVTDCRTPGNRPADGQVMGPLAVTR